MASAIISVVLTILLFFLTIEIYRAFFHPLSKYPGPLLWSVSRLPQMYYLARGTLPWKITQLHDKYGTVVRLAPTELSYISADAWNDIYGRFADRSQMRKDRTFAAPASGVNGLLFELDDTEHARLRRTVSYGFSDKSLREQEPIIMKYTNQFINALQSSNGKPVDMSQMFNFLLFDTTGDMTFGQSFNCLNHSALHPWIKILFNWVSCAAFLGMAEKFWPFTSIIALFIPRHLRSGDKDHAILTKERLDKRLEIVDERPDFITNPQKTLGTKNGMSYAELVETTRVLVVGGSETTASLLSGMIYYLLTHPAILQTLIAEIRTAFQAPSSITMSNVHPLPYLNAVINESLRIFPPLPGNFRRVTPPQGSVICGRFVPGNTFVAVDIFGANHTTLNLKKPYAFHPERWLPDKPSEFEDDDLAAVQPFSWGPRNCIGKNLALMEIRLMITSLLFHFDIELAEESKDWLKRVKAQGFYVRPKLMVKLTAVH